VSKIVEQADTVKAGLEPTFQIDRGKQWERYIELVKRCGAGTYGSYFMCAKDEQWKFIWAHEEIERLKAENKLWHEGGLVSASEDSRHRLEVSGLEGEIAKLRGMIDNGLGWDDMADEHAG
jgi:hypothetical protein